jgi:predicted metal-binding membrane protein
MSGSTHLENLLGRERLLIGLTLAVTIGLCWAWLVPMARDMYGPMTGPSAWMMTSRWDFPHQVLLFAMWVVMMIGMMLPSAAPTLLLYAGVVHKAMRLPAHPCVFMRLPEGMFQFGPLSACWRLGSNCSCVIGCSSRR